MSDITTLDVELARLCSQQLAIAQKLETVRAPNDPAVESYIAMAKLGTLVTWQALVRAQGARVNAARDTSTNMELFRPQGTHVGHKEIKDLIRTIERKALGDFIPSEDDISQKETTIVAINERAAEIKAEVSKGDRTLAEVAAVLGVDSLSIDLLWLAMIRIGEVSLRGVDDCASVNMTQARHGVAICHGAGLAYDIEATLAANPDLMSDSPPDDLDAVRMPTAPPALAERVGGAIYGAPGGCISIGDLSDSLSADDDAIVEACRYLLDRGSIIFGTGVYSATWQDLDLCPQEVLENLYLNATGYGADDNWSRERLIAEIEKERDNGEA